MDKAPFRAAVQPLFDDFKKDPNRPPCWLNLTLPLNTFNGQPLARFHQKSMMILNRIKLAVDRTIAAFRRRNDCAGCRVVWQVFSRYVLNQPAP